MGPSCPGRLGKLFKEEQLILAGDISLGSEQFGRWDDAARNEAVFSFCVVFLRFLFYCVGEVFC